MPPQDYRSKLALFVIVGGVGLFLILSYFGVFHWPVIHPERKRAIFDDPHHWQILSLGLAFFFAGVSFLVPRHWSVLGRICGAVVVLTLLAGIIGTFLAR